MRRRGISFDFTLPCLLCRSSPAASRLRNAASEPARCLDTAAPRRSSVRALHRLPRAVALGAKPSSRRREQGDVAQDDHPGAWARNRSLRSIHLVQGMRRYLLGVDVALTVSLPLPERRRSRTRTPTRSSSRTCTGGPRCVPPPWRECPSRLPRQSGFPCCSHRPTRGGLRTAPCLTCSAAAARLITMTTPSTTNPATLVVPALLGYYFFIAGGASRASSESLS